jgi:hypothetical protein
VPTWRHSDTDHDAPLLSRPDSRTGRSSHTGDGGGSRVSNSAAAGLACAGPVGVGVGVGVSAGVGVGVADGEVVTVDGVDDVDGVSPGLGVWADPVNTCAKTTALAIPVPTIAWNMPRPPLVSPGATTSTYPDDTSTRLGSLESGLT